MYKIVFVVAVFAFALQGALSSPVENESAIPASKPADVPAKDKNVENKPEDAPVTAATTAAPVDPAGTTAAPKSGASSTEMCLLLVQVSSLALVAKHMLL